MWYNSYKNDRMIYRNMNKKIFYKKIMRKIKKQPFIFKRDMENISKYGNVANAYNIQGCRQGIYFLYNSAKKIIYIGKVGTGESTSLYHRMFGHGSGAHKSEGWYEEVEYGKYIVFEKLNDFELSIVERLCIKYNPNKDNYNDKYFNDIVIGEIHDKIKRDL